MVCIDHEASYHGTGSLIFSKSLPKRLLEYRQQPPKSLVTVVLFGPIYKVTQVLPYSRVQLSLKMAF